MKKEDRCIEPGTSCGVSNYRIVIDVAGPIMVYGSPPMNQLFTVLDSNRCPSSYKKGSIFSLKRSPVALCRCGTSKSNPFCDGSHTKANWDSRLTAHTTQAHKCAKYYEGKTITLQDNRELCSHLGFCNVESGVWNLVTHETGRREEIKAIKEIVNLCPSGRLRLWERIDVKSMEDPLPRSLSLLEDGVNGTSGPIWVKGGISIDSNNGIKFEIRNRVTLCRCGASKNKPFCDGKHIDSQFKDNL